jgi:hypothetical protein
MGRVDHMERFCPQTATAEEVVTRALKHHGLWLTLAYIGVLLLMARAYA